MMLIDKFHRQTGKTKSRLGKRIQLIQQGKAGGWGGQKNPQKRKHHFVYIKKFTHPPT